MPRKYAQYYNTHQLNQGIKYEMSVHGLSRTQAEQVARTNLSQSPKYYQRIQQLTPVFKNDRRTYRRRQKRKMDDLNYNPFTQGSFFR